MRTPRPSRTPGTGAPAGWVGRVPRVRSGGAGAAGAVRRGACESGRAPMAVPRRTSDPRTRPGPPPTDLALLAVAVVAVSTSAPLIRVADAPTLAIAFWRNALALPVLVALAWWRVPAAHRRLTPRERRLSLIAGAFLAAHFATWVPSL